MTKEELENNQIISEFIGEFRNGEKYNSVEFSLENLYKRVVLFIQSIKLLADQ